MLKRWWPSLLLCGALLALTGLTLLTQGSARAGFAGQDKIVAPGLLADLAGGAERVKVIVLLQGYDQLASQAAGGAVDRVQAQAARLQEAVLAKVKPQEVQVGPRYAHIAAFAARVTAEGLRSLAALDEVARIEADRQVKLKTAQGLPQMGAVPIRDSFPGQGVSVAIIDTGVNYNHPALGGGGFPNAKVIGGYNFGDNTPDPLDDHGHGTACAGIAAGLNTAVGDYIGGVAPEAKVFALKVFPTGGDTADDSAIIAAIDWCVSHQYHDPANPIMVLSLSLGGNVAFEPCDPNAAAYATMVQIATASGMTIFVASGNEGYCNAMGYPACLSGVVSVGAVYDTNSGSRADCFDPISCLGAPSAECSADYPRLYAEQRRQDQVIGYSNSAVFLDLLAPSECVYTPDQWGGYKTCFNGTSAATPYAAGAAVVLQAYVRQTTGAFLAAEGVRQRLSLYGDCILDAKSGITRPRINLANAIAGVGGGGCSK